MNLIIKKIESLDFFLKTKKALKIILLCIVLFNLAIGLMTNQQSFPDIQSRKATSGFSPDKAHKFIYFYYYTDNFPLATINSDLTYSEKGANLEIQKRGEDLIMEYLHWSRLGENARIWAYLPNAWLKGSPENPTIRTFNILIFTISLVILFFGFWKVNKPLFGLILVLTVNCTPYFLYEVFGNENIFGLLGSVFFMIVGLNLPLIFSKSIDYFNTLLVSLVSGVLIGFFSEFRNEVSITIVVVLMIYLLSKRINWIQKVALIIIAIFFFNSTKTGIRNYFNLKFEKTSHLVSKHGGHLYNGARISGHNFWHPVFCGLGDYDTKYGYEWNDVVVYQYAIPVLNEKYNMDISYTGGYQTNNYYDEARLYYKKPEELPNYENVLKEKIISDIKNDPLWYASIIVKRIFKTMTSTIPLPYVGWLLIPLLIYLYREKKWDYMLLLIVSLPLSATSIIVFSGYGTTYNSVFVYFVICIIVLELYQKMIKEGS